MGLGGCASFDIVTILKKARQDVTNVVCELKQIVLMQFQRYLPTSICTL
jgi:uncharacterized OsmC-like protein